MKRIGVDVGGTFTDLIYVDGETFEVYKTSTTPHDPSIGVMEGINQLCSIVGAKREEIMEVFHGTTIATNMVLEGKGARVGMLTTEGFRDILHIARHKRPYNFSIMQDIPWQTNPVVQRRDRHVVSERVTAPNGEVLKPLDKEKARAAIRKMKEDGVEAISVCFLFSFLNPTHEQEVLKIIEEEFPEAYVSLRSEVSPQFREYESFTTTSLNSYVGPKTASYIKNLESMLVSAGYVNANLHLMQSGGGVATASAAAEKPVHLLMSGPAAGVQGAIWASKLTEIKNVISLDIGGTSADIAVIPNLKPGMKHLLDTQVGGYSAMIPMIDIGTIGAGGGSVAYIDEGGFFRVGPRSAGAVPGPACYDRGGTEPTVTDANILLGRLGTELLGGRMTIKPEYSRDVIQKNLADKLGRTVEECSLGIIEIMNNNMIQAIEKESIRIGLDPRDFALFACGGAGSLHACAVARELGMKTVIVPTSPGALCAVGLVATNLLYDFSKTEMQLSTKPDLDKLDKDFTALEQEALSRLKEDRVPEADISLQRVAECRYLGQGYELRVTVPNGKLTPEAFEKIKEDFHRTHLEFFGKDYKETAIEIVNIRVEGVGKMPELEIAKVPASKEDPSAAYKYSRDIIFKVNGEIGTYESKVYDRYKLRDGNVIVGPAVIDQMDTTVLIEPNCTATVNEYGIILIDIQ
ncbi:hydantoinase/oxoprolinase family protein [Paenibacillus xylaniclasticus]|uniref:hydantoinase/oxoprolinase family protein n=1 Tax=Paenibacillus xylaniclasticus TaxID=588083 RepID=UPI000FDB05EF|nr:MULTISPECIES: hydantoinase/oxoprolinase family protein [Paenibacillus]GFN33157.1 5-oxoprolinase [Paenibacillus curdlanolyticus]